MMPWLLITIGGGAESVFLPADDGRIVVIDQELRVVTVEAEARVVVVPAELRTVQGDLP